MTGVQTITYTNRGCRTGTQRGLRPDACGFGHAGRQTALEVDGMRMSSDESGYRMRVRQYEVGRRHPESSRTPRASVRAAPWKTTGSRSELFIEWLPINAKRLFCLHKFRVHFASQRFVSLPVLLTQGRNDVLLPEKSLSALFDCGGDEAREERMRSIRAGAELRMKLSGDVVRMIGDLHDFYQTVIRRETGADESRLRHLFSIVVVELETMTMPLFNR